MFPNCLRSSSESYWLHTDSFKSEIVNLVYELSTLSSGNSASGTNQFVGSDENSITDFVLAPLILDSTRT